MQRECDHAGCSNVGRAALKVTTWRLRASLAPGVTAIAQIPLRGRATRQVPTNFVVGVSSTSTRQGIGQYGF
jgi:hypothetical protein